MIFGNLNSGFNFKQDFVSKLGAAGEPYAIWWNLIGFGLVGLILIGFGINYGKVLNDKLAGYLLTLFGVGFTLTSVPIDMINSSTPISKVHIVRLKLRRSFIWFTFFVFYIIKSVISIQNVQSKNLPLFSIKVYTL